MKIKEQINQEEIIYEKTRVNQEKQRQKTQEWIDRFKAKASKAKQAQSKNETNRKFMKNLVMLIH